jgi:hypothetical protein
MPPIVGQGETIAAILAGSKRIGEAVPVRATFVQQGRRGARTRGPLAAFVAGRDEVALDLYLLVLTAASAPPHDVVRPAEVWLRSLGRDPRSKSSASVLSRAWTRLEERRLISRTRQGRVLRIELLCEDATGEPYTYPTGHGTDVYFKLPFAYWTENLQNRLTLRGKAMFLIALSLTDGFALPYERVPGWYGVSADTAQRGLRELQDLGLVEVRAGYKPAPLTAQGWTEERRYTLDARLRPAATRRRRAQGPTTATVMPTTKKAANNSAQTNPTGLTRVKRRDG